MDFKNYVEYFIMLIIACFGATAGHILRVAPTIQDKSIKEHLIYYLKGVFISSFIAYLTFEFSILIFDNLNLRVAMSGLSSFLGTPFLIMIEKELTELIKSKISSKK